MGQGRKRKRPGQRAGEYTRTRRPAGEPGGLAFRLGVQAAGTGSPREEVSAKIQE